MKFIQKAVLSIVLVTYLLGCTAEQNNPCLSDNINKIDFIPKQQIVMFGEIHGNNESPKTFIDLICDHLNTSDQELIVALEVYSDMQSHLETYIDSANTVDDKKQLVKHIFWQKDMQDGRSSIAMLKMFDTLRLIKRHFKDQIKVVLIDGKIERFNDQYSQHDRNGYMAENLKLLAEDQPHSLIYTLIGNFHNQKKTFPNLAHLTPTAKNIGKPYHSIDLKPTGRDSWVCYGPCGPSDNMELSDAQAEEQKQGLINQGIYDEVILIGKTTSSPPAKSLFQD